MPPSRCWTVLRSLSTLILPGATTAPLISPQKAQAPSTPKKSRITAIPWRMMLRGFSMALFFLLPGAWSSPWPLLALPAGTFTGAMRAMVRPVVSRGAFSFLGVSLIVMGLLLFLQRLLLPGYLFLLRAGPRGLFLLAQGGQFLQHGLTGAGKGDLPFLHDDDVVHDIEDAGLVGDQHHSGLALPEVQHGAGQLLFAPSSSRLELGSSSTTRRGSPYRARASPMRWRWPPERAAPCSPIWVS